jgi:hypothetical protein
MMTIQITPDLQELREGLTLSQPYVEPSHCADKVIEAGALAPNSDAHFASEICDLLARLEVASSRCSKEIARLLEEKSLRGKFQNVKDYLRNRSKKSGATKKKSTVV